MTNELHDKEGTSAKMSEEERIIKVMIDNTEMAYIRLTELASTDTPPSQGVFLVDKVDSDGSAHIGRIGFDERGVRRQDFRDVVRKSIVKLVCDKMKTLPSWLSENWIMSATVNFADTMVVLIRQ